MPGSGVPACGLQAFVPHEVGDHLEADPRVGHVLAEGMPEYVGAQPFEVGHAADLLDDLLDSPDRERASLLADERRFLLVLVDAGEALEPEEGGAGLGVERDRPLLAPPCLP